MHTSIAYIPIHSASIQPVCLIPACLHMYLRFVAILSVSSWSTFCMHLGTDSFPSSFRNFSIVFSSTQEESWNRYPSALLWSSTDDLFLLLELMNGLESMTVSCVFHGSGLHRG